jgi:hypothetical protein
MTWYKRITIANTSLPPIYDTIPDGNFSFYSQTSPQGEKCWLEKTLWNAAKNLPTKEIKISSFSNEDLNTAKQNLHNTEEKERTELANLNFPIIIYNNEIIDGFHRLAKLIQQHKPTATIVTLASMPPPDFIVRNPTCK